MTIKIHNVRLGFATNSSSTHSLVFLKPGQRATDRDVSGFDFGWDHWTAASREAKRQYVAIQLQNSLRDTLSDDVAEAVMRTWVGKYESDDDGKLARGHIDHQSNYVLPVSWDGKSPDKAFFDAFAAHIMRDDIAIAGGNDNTDERHHLTEGAELADLPILQDGRSGSVVARWDERFNYWTTFDRETGAKVRFSFDDPSMKNKIAKSSAPELVDIKITDFCPYGCTYCYQGSTTSGQHSEINWWSIASCLGDLRVFEVALGGGEPTLHPEFTSILSHFRSVGVIPNFTTKSLAWLRDEKVRSEVIPLIGAFAYSVESAKDVDALAALLTAHNVPASKANVQCVMGAVDMAELKAIVVAAAKASIRITLLGYKTTGRGSEFKPHSYVGWVKVIEALRKKHWFNLGIDTALALESEGELAAAKVRRELYGTREGAFSMYIDAVAGKLGASSYVDDIAMRRVKQIDAASIKSAFASYQGEAS